MNDRRPMLDRDNRARLGRKLSSDYNLLPDPLLPDRLKELVAILLLRDERQPFGETSDGAGATARRAA